MIMCHTANSHFALLLPPGLTSQCISSIMQRHWDPFHCVPQRAPCTQRSPSMIPRQAVQCEWFNSEATVTASTRDACLPACPAPRAWWLDYHTSRVHLKLSFLGRLKWHSVSQRELSVTPKAWPEKERRRGGSEKARSWREAKEEERKEEALPGSTVVQGTTG